MKINPRESLWVEKYRPQQLEDMLLPEVIKSKLKKDIADNNVQNLALFSNQPGTGKTSLAKSIIQELGGEALFLNASMENGIDTLRTKIMQFCTSESFDAKLKIIVLDESDNFSQDSQKALRGIIEQFSVSSRFILTGNYKDKIMDAVLDRFSVYDFSDFSREEMVKPIFERLKFVLENEKITYNPQDLIPVINTFYPSIRSAIKTLQQYSGTGELVLPSHGLDKLGAFNHLFDLVKAKDFESIIKECNKINSASSAYKEFFKKIDSVNPGKKLQYTVIIAKYQHMDSTARDKNLNLAAACAELCHLGV